jgi:hypothetical protein
MNPPEPESRAARWTSLILSCVAVAIPFLVVTYVPATDIAQHVAQIRLFHEAIADPGGRYVVQWLTPYALSYALLGALRTVAGPADAGRYALLVIAIFWVGAAHLLALRRGRPSSSALLASAFAFNISLYWGLYTFLFGWPIFAVWLLAVSPDRREPRSAPELVLRALQTFVLLTMLFLTHALWFLAAAGWVSARVVIFRPDWRKLVALASGGALASILPAVWYFSFRRSWYSAAESAWEPLSKFTNGKFESAIIGGMTGPVDLFFTIALLAWLVLGAWTNRDRLAQCVDVYLGACGATFVLAAVLLPVKLQSTVFFGLRWLPIGLMLVVLAAPAPKLASRALRTVTACILLAYCAATAGAWRTFEAEEMSGMSQAIAALPENPRVLGLDIVQYSECIKGRPFVQMFAYAQAEHGGMLNFSFAELPHSFVTFRDPAEAVPLWTPGLEWNALKLDPLDLNYFDYALVNGSDNAHEGLVRRGFVPATQSGRWRAYAVPHRR